MGRTVTDDQVSLLEIVTRRIEGHSNGILKSTMQVLARNIQREAQNFFQEIFTEFNSEVIRKINPSEKTLKWSGSESAYGYSENDEIGIPWRIRKFKRKNSQYQGKNVSLTKAEPNLFEDTGDLKEALSSNTLGEKAKGRIGALMFKKLGGVKPEYIKFNIPLPSGFERDARGKLFRTSSGAQVSYKSIVRKDMENRLNFANILVIPGTGTTKSRIPGRVDRKGVQGNISIFQAAQEGRIMSGMTFSIMKKLNTKALSSNSSYSPIVKYMEKAGLIDRKTKEKLQWSKKYGHHLIDPYFIRRIMGTASENPNGGSLESRLTKVQEKFFKGGTKRR